MPFWTFDMDGPVNQTMTYRLHKLHKITDAESQVAYLRDAGLSLSDGRCLAAIGSFPQLSIRELATQTNLNDSQASRGAQALVNQGLVVKTGSVSDGRGVVLKLTPAGRTAWKAVMKVIDERNQRIFQCLSEAELVSLRDMLDRLIDHNG